MKTVKRPNVLLIYTDQQRVDTLACYGYDKAVSPNLDRLASEGVVLKKYFVNNPVCMPSRMSMLTGRYPTSLGIGTNGIPFPSGRAVPVQSILKQYGYTTAQIGKLHFDPHARRDHRNPTDNYDFDTFILSDEPGCYDDAYTKWVECLGSDQLPLVRTELPPAALKYGRVSHPAPPRNTHQPYIFEGRSELTHSAFVASESCRFIESVGDKSFFMIAGFYAPHPPVNPPKEYLELFNVDEMPLPELGVGVKPTLPLKDFTDADTKKMVQYYKALATHVDDCVGEILLSLKSAKLEEDTLVIFTSDHGRIQKGMPGYDCIINVPLIIRYPGVIPSDQCFDQICEGVDIVPTILDYCGVQTPSFVQGESLKGLLSGKTATHKSEALVQAFSHNGSGMSTTIRNVGYMYHVDSDKELLYDLTIDPKQLKDVSQIPEYFDIISKMRLTAIRRNMKAVFVDDNFVAQY